MSTKFSFCPECKRWIPAQFMNYDSEQVVIRVCNFCLDGEGGDSYVEERNHERVRCVYCGSYNTRELVPIWNKFECAECKGVFRR